jgi:hypothetical protein
MDDDRVRWVPSSKQPNELISLELARQLLVERESGSARDTLVGDCSPTIGCRGEFVNIWYGGSILKVELAERAELAKVEATQAAVCDRIRELLGAEGTKLYRVEKRDRYAAIRGPLVIDELLPELWQSSKRDYRFLQKLILERNEDPSRKWWYALDRVPFMALLDAESGPIGVRNTPETPEPVAPSSILPIENANGEPKSPKDFVEGFYATEKRHGREPTTVAAFEEAWSTAGGRGHREEVRAAARQLFEEQGNPVQRGRPRNSPK